MLKASFTRAVTLITATVFLMGCASTWQPKTPEDPYESYNRAVFAFNLRVDRYVYRPVAKTYDTLTPVFVQNRIRNFFSNAEQPRAIVNDLLQVNMPWMVSDIGRFLVNTTLGVVGLFDPATPLGMKKRTQDFGLTLAVWGVRESPYFIFPFLPPSTARDFLGTGVDTFSPVWFYIGPQWVGYTAAGLDFVQQRARLLPLDKAVDQAFDPYIFVRDSYLQNRKSKVRIVLNPREEGDVPLAPAPESPQSADSETVVVAVATADASQPAASTSTSTSTSTTTTAAGTSQSATSATTPAPEAASPTTSKTPKEVVKPTTSTSPATQ